MYKGELVSLHQETYSNAWALQAMGQVSVESFDAKISERKLKFVFMRALKKMREVIPALSNNQEQIQTLPLHEWVIKVCISN